MTYRAKTVSYVRRSDRMSDRHERAWEQLHESYVLDIPRGEHSASVDPGFGFDAAAAYGRRAPFVVEIGIGAGDSVVHAAAERPDTDFLAIDVHRPGLAQTLVAMRSRGLTNIRLVQADAVGILATALASASVDELWVFFPDPWHKTRHHKRRLVTESFARAAARVLRPGGTWRLATDWEPYARQMRDVIDGDPDFERAWGSGDWAPRFDGRMLTKFEKKAMGADRPARDLAYTRR